MVVGRGRVTVGWIGSGLVSVNQFGIWFSFFFFWTSRMIFLHHLHKSNKNERERKREREDCLKYKGLRKHMVFARKRINEWLVQPVGSHWLRYAHAPLITMRNGPRCRMIYSEFGQAPLYLRN